MDNHCPKCSTEKTGESCPKCGLVFDKFDWAVLEEGVPEDIKFLWKEVEKNWDDKSRHAVFVEQALSKGIGGYAAACYRRHGDNPRAEEYLELINKRLEQMLSSVASTPKPRTHGRIIGALLLVTILVGLTIFFLLFYSGTPA
ncbi:MAG: hypothetical protein GY847_15150 [Proteobacteria bacterium]|nr:hypothetical protein [Pseudomonadota bacterium]